jgi:hypothetical protein
MKRRLIFGLVAVRARAEPDSWRGDLFKLGARDGCKGFAGREPGDFRQGASKGPHGSYVDGTNLTYRGLDQSAIKGMVGSLDPHSEFLDAQDYQQLQDDTKGSSAGWASWCR